MKTEYYYVACQANDKANSEYQHYFRLYKTVNNRAILVEQGLADLPPKWEKQYDAVFSYTNPYPNLD